jgi:phospholipid N-methyltransferase
MKNYTIPVRDNMLNSARSSLKSQWSYLQNFILSPRTVGTLAPSSPWLCRAMLSQADWQQSQHIAELGSADGVLTRRILSHMRDDAQLSAFEIQPAFINKLNTINDHRLRIMPISAERIEENYDIIFSCLPLLSMPTRISMKILQRSCQALKAKQGVMIQFQYSHLSEKLLSRYFVWRKMRVVKNFPPALVYVCRPK